MYTCTSVHSAAGDIVSETHTERHNCSNLYEVSELAAKRLSRYSAAKLDTKTVYALFCDPIYKMLIPESYMGGDIKAVQQRTYISYMHVVKRNGHGYKVEGDVSETTQINSNQYVGRFASLRSYTQGVTRLYAGNLADHVCHVLTNEHYYGCITKLYEELHDDAAVRLLYRSLVDEVERYNEFGDKDGSRAMFFILEKENLYNALKSHDYNKFLYEMHDAATKDIFTVKQVVIQPIIDAISDTRRLYNTLLTCAIAYSQHRANPLYEHDQYLLGLALTSLNTLLLQSPKLQKEIAQLLGKQKEKMYPLTRANIHTLLTDHEHSFLDCVSNDDNIKAVTSNCPITIDANQNLERIAAATLVLYPGAKISGDEIILLRKSGPSLLNTGNIEINLNNPYFRSADEGIKLHQEYNIADDIRSLFLSLQEVSHHLNWEVFVEELRAVCAQIQSVKFAEQVKPAIARVVTANLPYCETSNDIQTVVYESILPRVEDIEVFLRNKQLVDCVGHLTKLVHDPRKDVLTTSDFLLLSGYQHCENTLHNHTWANEDLQFFGKIDRNHGRFSMHFPSSPAVNVKKPQENQPVSTYQVEEKHKISPWDSKLRKSIIKKFADRPFFSTLRYRLFYPTISAAVVATCFFFYLLNIVFTPVLTVLLGATYTFTLLILTHLYGKSTLKSKDYVMSVPQDLKNAEFLPLGMHSLCEKPNQYKNCTSSSSACEAALDDAQRMDPGNSMPDTNLQCRVSEVFMHNQLG
ncbi:MAG: hypothetical protein AB8U44_04295 [Aaplasma endosymbiont of Hyalomma asiaticum]